MKPIIYRMTQLKRFGILKNEVAPGINELTGIVNDTNDTIEMILSIFIEIISSIKKIM